MYFKGWQYHPVESSMQRLYDFQLVNFHSQWERVGFQCETTNKTKPKRLTEAKAAKKRRKIKSEKKQKKKNKNRI